MIGAPQVRVHELKDCTAMLDVFQKHGPDEIDSALMYGGGSSEERLGQLSWQERAHHYGHEAQSAREFGPKSYSHKKDDLKPGLLESLQALRTDKVDLWYLHVTSVSWFL